MTKCIDLFRQALDIVCNSYSACDILLEPLMWDPKQNNNHVMYTERFYKGGTQILIGLPKHDFYANSTCYELCTL